jgi:hypothetical protein
MEYIWQRLVGWQAAIASRAGSHNEIGGKLKEIGWNASPVGASLLAMNDNAVLRRIKIIQRPIHRQFTEHDDLRNA